MNTAAALGLAFLGALASGLAAAPALAQDLPSGPVSLAGGMVTIGADVSVSATAQDDEDGAWFNYTDYEHNALKLFRVAVTADVKLSDRVSVLTELRTENGGHLEPYALYVRVRPWLGRPLDVQAGRIPPVFGAFARRDYGSGNPLIGYPLAYQYLTPVRPDALPATTDDVLRMRTRGWRPSYPIGSLEVAPGLPLITAFRWDTGVQVRVGPEERSVAVAVTNGTMSDPRTRDTNGGRQLAARGQWRPNAALSLGVSAARGPYVADAALASASLAAGDVRSTQRALGFDADYARDRFEVRGEVVWDEWQVPTLARALSATAAFAEGRYKVAPGLFVASRIDRLSFSTLPSSADPAVSREWDAPVTRLETGVGYYLRRNLLAKLAYQHNWRDGGLVRSRGLLAGQVHFWL